ncbi:MAG TPA: hypothetical protein VKH36_01635 [Acidimicrobiia bacterium]|nr:hypothetical protein [Acidimicrobiia bacterium]
MLDRHGGADLGCLLEARSGGVPSSKRVSASKPTTSRVSKSTTDWNTPSAMT